MQDKQIKQTKQFVFDEHGHDTTGHDFNHILRVQRMALYIGKQFPSCNLFILQMVALLHDVADHKLADTHTALKKIQAFLESIEVPSNDRSEILSIIPQISYSAQTPLDQLSIEAKIIQDADRLDALGAIGIARAFAYGGATGQKMASDEDFELDHVAQNETSVGHFYDKLFKLPDTLHTSSAKKIANQRIKIMYKFIEIMDKEWKGVDYLEKGNIL